MSRSTGRHEIDKLLGYVRKAGFDVEPWGGSYWRVTHPDSGERIRLACAPVGKRLGAERSKLRRIGAPTNEQELAAFQASPNPEPEPEIRRGRLYVDGQPQPDNRPPAQETTVTTAPPAAPNPQPDVASSAYVVWGSIREQLAGDVNAETQTMESVPGYLWRGSFNDVFTNLWPDIDRGNEVRKRVNAYLRTTGNMLCLRRSTPSLWWLRDEWNDTTAAARVAAAVVRGPARPTQPRTSAGPPAPVTIRHAPRAVTSAPCGDDPVAAVTAMLDRARALEAENARLVAENATLQAQLDAVNRALGRR